MSNVENNGRSTGGCTRRGFLPGQSGNPGGRPKGLAAFIRNETQNGEDLVKLALRFVKGQKVAGRKPRHQDMIKAMEYLTDRGFGKSVDMKMDLTPEDEQRDLAKQIARELAANPMVKDK
ncbi:MAG: hypothetical protein WAO02_10645 [Verrucomicrobiia bacterium]